MVVGEIPEPADLLVAGAGPAGCAGAIRAAELGRRVVLVDRGGPERLGGDCLHATCIPGNALIEAADVAYRAGNSGDAGVTGALQFDLRAWQRWRRGVVDGLRGDIDRALHAAGVTVVTGELHFTRVDQAVVAGDSGAARYFQFTDALIATGSRPAASPGLQPDGVRILDAAGLLSRDDVPDRLAVIGAGPTGVELATAFAKLGSTVTVIERRDGPLPGVDERLVRAVSRRWRVLGVQVLTRSTAVGDNGCAVQIDAADGPRSVKADIVLVATGRMPNTDMLGLDRVGVRPGSDGRLAVGLDRRLGAHLAAAGDVTPGPSLAHTACAEARVAAAALSGQRVAYQPQAVPFVVFADPQLATVGLTAAQARAMGVDAREVQVPLAESWRARTTHLGPGSPDGGGWLVVDADDGTVLGVHLAGPHAAELAGTAVTAIEFGATVDDLARIVMPSPALSDSFVHAAELARRLGLQPPAATPVAVTRTSAS